MKDLFKHIMDAHSHIRKFVCELEEKSMREKGEVASEFAALKATLIPHLKAEEQAFYPVLFENRDAHIHAFAALEVHRLAKVILADLEEQQEDAERWAAQFGVLRELFFKHIDEEEETLFPFFEDVAEDLLSQALKRMLEVEEQVAEEITHEPVSFFMSEKNPELEESRDQLAEESASARLDLKSEQ